MKKNELLHVHSLLLALARQFTERGVVSDEALDSYRETGVTPMSLRAARDDHVDAVLELATALGGSLDAADPTAGDDVDEADDGQPVVAESE
ncbi:UPF0058 family protein [Halobaculum sp. MBLA0143]|uniref:UPF0058 family protein n=1 Tax=Halobaculum sp. MBLA0143 TaxID=3079933 RepID=UPI00352640E9